MVAYHLSNWSHTTECGHINLSILSLMPQVQSCELRLTNPFFYTIEIGNKEIKFSPNIGRLFYGRTKEIGHMSRFKSKCDDFKTMS